jgi:hypothetical protein
VFFEHQFNSLWLTFKRACRRHSGLNSSPGSLCLNYGFKTIVISEIGDLAVKSVAESVFHAGNAVPHAEGTAATGDGATALA